MADSHLLADLHPRVRVMAGELLARSAAAGVPLTVTFTLRSMATQTALYARGRSCPGCVVTNARAGYSFHNYGLAVDVAPTELIALPRWGDTPEHQARAHELWNRVGVIGKSIGFRWGGDFARLSDRPHFEWSGDLSLAQLRGGARCPDTVTGGEKP